MNWTESTLTAAIDYAPGGVLEGRDSRGGKMVLSRPTWADVNIIHHDKLQRVKGEQAAEYCNAWGFAPDTIHLSASGRGALARKPQLDTKEGVRPLALRVPQTPETGLGAVIGKWPGDETDAEVADGLKSTEGAK